MVKYFKAKIIDVSPDSVAARHHLQSGDSLLSVDGQVIRDLLDYRFLIYDAKKLTLLVEKSDNTREEIVINKKSNEDLGLTFESAVFDRVKPCTNKCIFCFVDQQPDGLRETLYIKDDDYRLSYLQGTYITLTNLSDADKKRIEQLRLGPLYVSVHTTDPFLREKMLNNPKAGTILDQLAWLNDLFIPVHTQIVVCPGFNDGAALQKTLKDLASLDNVLSVAVVPVGITVYREGEQLTPFTKEIARETIRLIHDINDQKGFYFAFPSDEIYILAGEEIPDEDFYNDFPQLEDGVGAVRLTLKNFESLPWPEKLINPTHVGLITGKLAANALNPAFDKLNQIDNFRLDVFPVESRFWGDQVTVAGLVVGQDIVETLEKVEDLPKEIFIPSVMLRPFTDDFLDGITKQDIEKRFGVTINVIRDFYRFDELHTWMVKGINEK